jgi:predicted metal-binding membrane protein
MMDAPVARLVRPRWTHVRWLARQHPELGAAGVVTAAWAMLFAGVTRDDHLAHHARTITEGLPHWVVMTVAMMGPATLAAVRHTGVNSLWWRRGRATIEFSAAYLAVWTMVGAVALWGASFVPRGSGWIATGLALALAAAWQVTPFKYLSLRRCHRSVPLPPRGWRAEVGAVRFGLHNGCACVGSCWCLMLVMAVVPNAHVLWTAALATLSTTERLVESPRRATRRAALVLAVAAVGAFCVAIA